MQPQSAPPAKTLIQTGEHMKPSQALRLKRHAVLSAIGRAKASNPRVFGSVLRGTDSVDSDLDLLVDPLPGATLFSLSRLQDDLEDVLGIRIDLVTPGDLSPRFRARVLDEARPL